jgi:tRNA A37 methylthiotransferase MiaB
VDELAGDPRIAQLYSLWYEQREAVQSTYKSEMPERIALSQNSEFKAIKNAIIAEAAQLMPEQTQTARLSEQQAAHAQQVAPENVAGDVALGSMQLLRHLSRMIENKVDEGPKQAMVESKLLAEIREHKREMGLRDG